MNENPLLKALPPETDYVTYLTILEFNLSRDQLPTLHEILQDVTLTTNIGWDLVHLLLPLLPESKQCLQDVARLGNPREVILKVTESLEAIGNHLVKDEDVDSESGEHDEPQLPDEEAESSSALSPDAPVKRSPNDFKTLTLQFEILLDMLSVLHLRIKTKYPSRFLFTSLKAILFAYSHLATEDAATMRLLEFVKQFVQSKKPELPSRSSSSTTLVTVDPLSSNPTDRKVSETNETSNGTPSIPDLEALKRKMETLPLSAPDPEAQENDGPAPNEMAIQTREVQSFLTCALNDYIEALPSVKEAPGLAWAKRLQEAYHPEKIIPGRQTHTAMFQVDPNLTHRDEILRQFRTHAYTLNISPSDVISIIQQPDPGELTGEDTFPAFASQVRFSYNGSLYLLSAWKYYQAIEDQQNPPSPLTIFPEHAQIVGNFIGNLGKLQKDTVVDAVLLLGLHSLHHDTFGSPSDEEFKKYLQNLSMVSVSSQLDTVRDNANTLFTSVLHRHPSESARLEVMMDMLEHCPFEKLKAVAAGCLRKEITMAAYDDKAAGEGEVSSIFASPRALEKAAPFLFPDIRSALGKPSPANYPSFSDNAPYYLDVMNLLYVLCTSPKTFDNLKIAALNDKHHIVKFVTTLQSIVWKYQDLAEGGEMGPPGPELEAIEMELLLIDNTIDRTMDHMVEAGLEDAGFEGTAEPARDAELEHASGDEMVDVVAERVADVGLGETEKSA